MFGTTALVFHTSAVCFFVYLLNIKNRTMQNYTLPYCLREFYMPPFAKCLNKY